ncbi:unnamed protein product [Thlaspi arvense]|uniref:Salicylate carboxymethyltransferase n=1 Tax=Thlaspi arvense TaxID=13288 RepID=A0AAU9SW25_THLAR|nr:unnamed protein product [Thlaspi arvense]
MTLFNSFPWAAMLTVSATRVNPGTTELLQLTVFSACCKCSYTICFGVNISPCGHRFASAGRNVRYKNVVRFIGACTRSPNLCIVTGVMTAETGTYRWMAPEKDFEREFHMTGGVGRTSYARNSSLQKKASDEARHITLETLQQLYKETRPKSLGIADLGCSSGPNTLSTIRDMIKAVESAHRQEITSHPLPEFSFLLNDLPGNDFNSIFKSLPDFHTELKRDTNINGDCPSVFIAAYPGSFYGRLFPERTIHFIYSSYSLHWLSKIPPAIYDDQGKSINKGCVNICSSSPEAVSKAYYSQFKEDFSIFLRHRSEELVASGRMVLIILGREGPDHVDRGNSFFWELLARSIADLVAQGETEEEKLDSYEMHFYAPSGAEIEGEVKKEGSFELERLEMLQVDKEKSITYGKAVAKTVRAVQESMLAQHFGEEILDKLFDTYGRMIEEELAKEDIRTITFVLVLKRKI